MTLGPSDEIAWIPLKFHVDELRSVPEDETNMSIGFDFSWSYDA